MTIYEHTLKNDYIWEYTYNWTPDASRTMLYLKFENNLTDSSWNNQSVSWAWIGYWTTGNKYYVERTGTASWTYINPPQTLMQGIWSWDFTVSFFLRWVNWWWDATWIFVNEYDSSSPWYGFYIRWFSWTGEPTWLGFVNTGWGSPSDVVGISSWNILYRRTWYHVCCTRISWVVYLYINWQEVWHATMTRSFANPWVSKFRILNRNDYTSQAWGEAWTRMSEVILEKVWWTAEQVLWYYNWIKSNYQSS